MHIVLKNAYFMSSSDLNIIQEQMLLYRTNTRNTRPNTRSGISLEDARTFGIAKMMNYMQSECDKVEGMVITGTEDQRDR